MKTKILFLTLICFVSLFSACGDDEEDNNVSQAVNCQTFSSDLAEETQALTEALTNYLTDQSSANCNAYLAAIDKYLVAVEPFVKQCGTNDDFAQFQEAIDDFEESRNQLPCN